METQEKLALMQNTYAASVAETVNTYEKLKVLDYVTEKRKEKQAQTAPYMNKQLGINTVEEVFTTLAETFGCADWKVEKVVDGYLATATTCKLCALSKKMGGASPCYGWCLDPMAAMAAAISGSDSFIVESTLMEGDCCKVRIKTN